MIQLASLLADLEPHHPAWTLAEIAADKAREEGRAKFTSEMPPPPPQPSTDLLGVRAGMAEMRAMGSEITATALLSSGESVGEFLLRIWQGKEAARKHK